MLPGSLPQGPSWSSAREQGGCSTRGVIATFALPRALLTSQRETEGPQPGGRAQGGGRSASLRWGLLISEVIPALPHYQPLYMMLQELTVTTVIFFENPVSLLQPPRRLCCPPAPPPPPTQTRIFSFHTARLSFPSHFTPTSSSPLVTFKNSTHEHNYREKLHGETLSSNNERFGEKSAGGWGRKGGLWWWWWKLRSLCQT